jgi:hypothetical protein
MKWFDALSQSVRGAIAGVRHWAGARTRRGPRIRFQHVEDLPDSLQPATLYVAGEEPHLWAAAILCPCGCGEVIHLNLLEDATPSWTLRHHRDGSVTVLPSVWRTKGCRSHFFIRNSRIVWCRFEGEGAEAVRIGS